MRGPIGPTGPGGPQGPPGPPGVCPSSCPDVGSRTFPVKRNLLEKKIEKAAFQIALSNSAYTTLESVVVWDTIITNRGNMFNLSSGIFTASKPGKSFSPAILESKIWTAHFSGQNEVENMTVQFQLFGTIHFQYRLFNLVTFRGHI